MERSVSNKHQKTHPNSPACEICEAPMQPLFDKKDCHYEKCPQCKLVRIFPQPTDAQLSALYDTDYYVPWGDESTFRPLKKKTFDKILTQLLRFLDCGQGKKLLDIGAATGVLMEEAASRGFETYGIEASSDGSALIAEKFGQGRICKDYFTGSFSCWANIDFDVICMIDLLEHVRKPQEVLKKACSMLSDNGFLVAVCPNVTSITNRLMGKYWPHYIDQHLFSFSVDNITTALQQNGFHVIKSGAFPKYMSLAYMYPVLTRERKSRFFDTFFSLLPMFIVNMTFPLYTGEFLVIAQKKVPSHALKK